MCYEYSINKGSEEDHVTKIKLKEDGEGKLFGKRKTVCTISLTTALNENL